MQRTHPADYDYKRYRIAPADGLPATTISLDRLKDLRLSRRAGGPDKLSAIVRAEAARIRASDYPGKLSAAVLKAVQAVLS